jgi:hypothetical protein
VQNFGHDSLPRAGLRLHPASSTIRNWSLGLALYFVWYNFVRTHKAHRLSPAMAARVTDKLWDVADILRLVDEYDASNKHKVA